jgi:hypothetical protein
LASLKKAAMKKINFLSGREKHDRPQLVLSIFLSVVFFSSPLSGLLNPGNISNISEKQYHDDPQGFFTFFVLIPDKNFREDTTRRMTKTAEVKELSMDTTPKNPTIQNISNLVIW